MDKLKVGRFSWTDLFYGSMGSRVEHDQRRRGRSTGLSHPREDHRYRVEPACKAFTNGATSSSARYKPVAGWLSASGFRDLNRALLCWPTTASPLA
jgi:hypothetical protein